MYLHYQLHWKPWFVSASGNTLKDGISKIIWSLGFLAAAHTWPNCTSAVLTHFSYLHSPHRQWTQGSHNHPWTGISKIPLHYSCGVGRTRNPLVLCSVAPLWKPLSLSTSSTAFPSQIGCSPHLGSTLHVWVHIKNCFPTNRTKRGHISLVLCRQSSPTLKHPSALSIRHHCCNIQQALIELWQKMIEAPRKQKFKKMDKDWEAVVSIYINRDVTLA